MNFVEKNTEMPCLAIVDKIMIRLKKTFNIQTVNVMNARTKSLTSILRSDLDNLVSKLKENVKCCAPVLLMNSQFY